MSQEHSFIHPEDLTVRKWVFFFFAMGNFWLAFDNGIIPACQIQMMQDLSLTQAEIAFLSSAVNIGLAVSTLVVSPIMAVIKTKHVIVVTFLLNAAASCLFGFSSSFAVLTVARFLLGFTQAFCFVYAPIWINEFSPKSQSTQWLALNQSCALIGVIAGYCVGALSVDMPVEYNFISMDWRKGFLV